MAQYRISGTFRIDDIEPNPDVPILLPISFTCATSDEVKQFINQKVNENVNAAGQTAAVWNGVKTAIGA